MNEDLKNFMNVSSNTIADVIGDLESFNIGVAKDKLFTLLKQTMQLSDHIAWKNQVKNPYFESCPICNETPKIVNAGNHIVLSCCSNMDFKKSDYLDQIEIKTWDTAKNNYSLQAERKAFSVVLSIWNSNANREH
ncbi:MAG: hypothetical protein WC656_01345 [Sulfurimonas sp.]|jgi:hypothetical protein